jgi:hypothetical protein
MYKLYLYTSDRRYLVYDVTRSLLSWTSRGCDYWFHVSDDSIISYLRSGLLKYVCDLTNQGEINDN